MNAPIDLSYDLSLFPCGFSIFIESYNRTASENHLATLIDSIIIQNAIENVEKSTTVYNKRQASCYSIRQHYYTNCNGKCRKIDYGL